MVEVIVIIVVILLFLGGYYIFGKLDDYLKRR